MSEAQKPAQKTKIDQIIDWAEKSDYYQILNLARTANSAEMKTAYFKLSQQYHPDKYYAKVDAGTRKKITLIFKRLNEAYSVLKDPQKRAKYDKLAFGPEREKNLRFQFGDEDRGPANPEDQAATVNGKKYLRLALVAQKKKDWRAAEMNLNFAIKYEPENEYFKKFLQTVKVEITKLPKEDPFKIR